MANQVVYGFHALQDRFGALVNTFNDTVVNTAITQSMAEHNRRLDAVRALFVRSQVDPQTVFRTPGTTRNQPLDEYGRPIPIKAAARYTVGFPLIASGNAVGWTWMQAQNNTLQDLNDAILSIQDGDQRWVFDHILGALFANADYTHYDADRAGTLTVKPLANGDTQTYMVFAGQDAAATDSHFLAQAAAIGAGADNPFATIVTELKEHPENGNGDIIVFVPSSNYAAVAALTTFNPLLDPNIQPGANSDRLVGTLGVPLPGTLRGYDDAGAWVVEWPRLPANYLVAVATGGEAPIGERVPPVASMQGFFEMDESRDMPWYQRNWARLAGYGAWNRVGALVYRVGNASYAVPTNYSVPMP
jgi:hypothetical protein